jgi:putative transposase
VAQGVLHAGRHFAMARPPRLDVPSVPQHVVVRGVDRKPCFYANGDFAAYLDDLSCSAQERTCAIHAYVLMTNHVHLLVTGATLGAVSRLMQCVGRRYVRRFNAAWRRTGTLFEGRFRASVVESERYLLTCMRYIELNPVRAGMVRSPFDYRWSSVHTNAGLRHEDLVTAHEEYRRLGNSDAERAAAYRDILAQGIESSDIDMIRQHVNRDCALGSAAFQIAMARVTGRRAHIKEGGRPRSADAPSVGMFDDLW